jgi:outer membrane immunogenic protein
MKKFLLTSVAAIAFCDAPALAADLPTKAPVYRAAPVQLFSWTGCYVGGNVGGGWGHKGFTDDDLTPGIPPFIPASSASANTSGWLAGGQVGCDYQFATNWVAGIEGAGSWANIKGSSDPFFGGKAVFNAQTKWLASTTARLGYTQDHWLIYATGGAAWAGDKYQVPGSFIVPFDFQGSETRSGWILGGGIEWLFLQNWSAKLEYAYYNFGTRSITLADSLGDTDPSSISQRIQTVTFGINYRFATGKAPVSAKY